MAAKSFSTLTVRINPELFSEFTKYTKEHSVFTQAHIVESLIRYFMKQGDEQRYLLAMGVGRDYLGLIGEALQLITWGDHAFRGSHWRWVIEIYNELDRISAEAQENVESEKKEGDSTPNNLEGILSLRRIAWFKLGRAWINVAKGLRNKALIGLARLHREHASRADAVARDESKPDDWKELYDAAIHSLQIAIADFHLFNKSLETPHPTVLYNKACAWTLIAQYITEQNADNEVLRDLAEEKLKEEEKRRSKAKKQMSKVCLPPSLIPEVNHAIGNASKNLKNITVKYEGEAEGMPFEDAQWMFDFADYDPDLACLPRGEEDDFGKWLKKGRSRLSLLYSYRRLSGALNKDIVSELHKVERGIVD